MNKIYNLFPGLKAALEDFSKSKPVGYKMDPGYGYSQIYLIQLLFETGNSLEEQYGLCIWNSDTKQFEEEPAEYLDYKMTVEKAESKYGFTHDHHIKETKILKKESVDSALKAAIKTASIESKENGNAIQHIEKLPNGKYNVSDWYDEDLTVLSITGNNISNNKTGLTDSEIKKIISGLSENKLKRYIVKRIKNEIFKNKK